MTQARGAIVATARGRGRSPEVCLTPVPSAEELGGLGVVSRSAVKFAQVISRRLEEQESADNHVQCHHTAWLYPHSPQPLFLSNHVKIGNVDSESEYKLSSYPVVDD